MFKMTKCWFFCNRIPIRPLFKLIPTTNHARLIIYFIAISLFTTEILIYYLATFKWFPLECAFKSKCTRILLVADPQIIGLHNDHALLTPFSIWDSDRYLSKTYAYAFNFAKPDVVIFLGDLFDEGSSAAEDEFKLYLRRLFNLFLRKPYHETRHLWLPGDNDIGGELGDSITNRKVERFEHAFQQPDTMAVNNVKFYKINRLTSRIPKFSQKNDFNSLSEITVGVSHIPLLMVPAVFVDKVIEKMQPHVLFAAHTHHSMIVSIPQGFAKDRLITPVRPDDNKVHRYFLGITDIYEILVPTCSYRMGTDKIGYGFAVIDNESIQYTVLWTPSRFPQLFFYLGLGAFCLCYAACCMCCRWRRKCKRHPAV